MVILVLHLIINRPLRDHVNQTTGQHRRHPSHEPWKLFMLGIYTGSIIKLGDWKGIHSVAATCYEYGQRGDMARE